MPRCPKKTAISQAQKKKSRQFSTVSIDNDWKLNNSKKWRFNIQIEPDWRWSCPLKTMQCISIKQNGERCKRTSTLTIPFCWQHLKLDAHVTVDRTMQKDRAGRRMKFLGLFACDPKKPKGAVVFDCDQIIVPYVGDVLNRKQLRAKYDPKKNNPYVLTINQQETKLVDAACMRSAASISNTCKRSRNNPCRNNATYVLHRGVFPKIRASKKIKNGEEILTNYGRKYRLEPSNIMKTSGGRKKYYSIKYKCPKSKKKRSF